jgi:hypothetical protein
MCRLPGVHPPAVTPGHVLHWERSTRASAAPAATTLSAPCSADRTSPPARRLGLGFAGPAPAAGTPDPGCLRTPRASTAYRQLDAGARRARVPLPGGPPRSPFPDAPGAERDRRRTRSCSGSTPRGARACLKPLATGVVAVEPGCGWSGRGFPPSSRASSPPSASKRCADQAGRRRRRPWRRRWRRDPAVSRRPRRRPCSRNARRSQHRRGTRSGVTGSSPQTASLSLTRYRDRQGRRQSSSPGVLQRTSAAAGRVPRGTGRLLDPRAPRPGRPARSQTRASGPAPDVPAALEAVRAHTGRPVPGRAQRQHCLPDAPVRQPPARADPRLVLLASQATEACALAGRLLVAFRAPPTDQATPGRALGPGRGELGRLAQ